MASSEMLRRVALVRTDVSEELSASFIRVTLIGDIGTFLRSVRRLLVTANVVPSSPILVTLMKEALSSSETSVLTRATRRNTPEYAILHVSEPSAPLVTSCRGTLAPNLFHPLGRHCPSIAYPPPPPPQTDVTATQVCVTCPGESTIMGCVVTCGFAV
jgi:hypothetical protein